MSCVDGVMESCYLFFTSCYFAFFFSFAYFKRRSGGYCCPLHLGSLIDRTSHLHE